MSTDLEADIRRVLGNRVDSAGASDVAHRVDLSTTALTAKIAQAEADAINPLLDVKAAARAKADLDDLTFKANRLAAARTALTVRIDELRRAEEQAEREAERAAALAERDALVTILRDEVPGLIQRWTQLVRDIDASDARLSIAGMPMESAESVARGYGGNGRWANGAGMALRLRDAKLPLFNSNGLAWHEDGGRGLTVWAALEG